MPNAKPFPRQLCRSVYQRTKISPGTGRKLGDLAKSLGIRYNATGRLLDLFVDIMVAAAGSVRLPAARGYGRLSAVQVRAIRRSTEKLDAIAAEHGVSHSLVVRIRARTAYRWVTAR